jgi:dihydrofolate reductase
MGAVVIDVSVSLDGYMAAPNDVPGNGLGDDGMRLHNWMFDDPSIFERIYGDLRNTTGAVIIGRRTYDNSVPEWGGSGPLGDDVRCFVLTHEAPASAPRVFTFVTDGIESALEQAQAAAGDKQIGVMGGDTATQYLDAGLVDQLRIHIVNVLLGDGRRLFGTLPERVELRQTGVTETDGVTHIEYRVVR